MKKLMNLMAYAAIVLISVLVSMSIASCDSKMDVEFEEPVLPPTPKDTIPTTHTEKSDTTTSTPWRHSTIMDQTVDFDVLTETVTALNISELTRQVGNASETKLDSATLRYTFGVECSAPTHIVTMSSDTTTYCGKGLQKSSYGDWYRQGTDSLHKVTTFVEGGFRTQYYTVSLTTNRLEGYSLHAGKWVPYKNVTESSQMTSVWHEAITEVERNDSIFDRETVHNVITITLTSDKGKKWQITREKKVVVDHFKKMKQQEPEEPVVEADYWVKGLGKLVSLTKSLREDRRLWCDVALLEGGDGYTMVIDTYDTDGKFVGREVKYVSFEVCPQTNDYDGVLYVNGGFYPGKITYDSTSRGWVIATRVNGEVVHQTIDPDDAVARGIKNFKNNNTAYPWPYMTSTSTSKEVNGKKVITVSGKTSTRAYRGCIVADSLLK